MRVCKEASACPLLHRRGAIDLADFRQSIAGLLFLPFLFFFSFFFSHVYLLSFAPPCSSPNSNQILSIGDSATCKGEMYVPRCGFWRGWRVCRGHRMPECYVRLKIFPVFLIRRVGNVVSTFAHNDFRKEKHRIKILRSSKDFKASNQTQRFQDRAASFVISVI